MSELTKRNAFSEMKKNRNNPFEQQLLETVAEHTVSKKEFLNLNSDETSRKSSYSVVQNETGEVQATSAFVKTKRVDSEQFVKLMVSKVSAFWGMPKPATKIFSYIASNLTPNKDNIVFMMDDVLEFCGWKTTKSAYVGLTWLAQNGFIAKGRSNSHIFINPTIFVNGNRLTIAETYINKDLEKKSMEHTLNHPGQLSEGINEM